MYPCWCAPAERTADLAGEGLVTLPVLFALRGGEVAGRRCGDVRLAGVLALWGDIYIKHKIQHT